MKNSTIKNVDTEMSVKTVVKAFETNTAIVDSLKEHFKTSDKDFRAGNYVIVKKETYLKAMEILDAKAFEAQYRKEGGKYIAERLRDGYIGKVVSTDIGTNYIQSKRGKPFGTAVSIPGNNGESYIGCTYILNEKESDVTPILGIVYALKRALKLKESLKGKELDESKYLAITTDKTVGGIVEKSNMASSARAQIIHFLKRSTAYWNPNTFSYSRGTNPVIYENYDEIHKNRNLVLGKETSNVLEFKDCGKITISEDNSVIVNNVNSTEPIAVYPTVKEFWETTFDFSEEKPQPVDIEVRAPVYRGTYDVEAKEWVYPTGDFNVGDYFIYMGKARKLSTMAYETVKNKKSKTKSMNKGDLIIYNGEGKWSIYINN